MEKVTLILKSTFVIQQVLIVLNGYVIHARNPQWIVYFVSEYTYSSILLANPYTLFACLFYSLVYQKKFFFKTKAYTKAKFTPKQTFIRSKRLHYTVGGQKCATSHKKYRVKCFVTSKMLLIKSYVFVLVHV